MIYLIKYSLNNNNSTIIIINLTQSISKNFLNILLWSIIKITYNMFITFNFLLYKSVNFFYWFDYIRIFERFNY